MLVAGLCLLPSLAHAQYIEGYFPAGVPGYGGEAGITVLSRARSIYDPEDIHLGAYDIRASVTEGFGYDSNVEGLVDGRGSALVDTAASLAIDSNWARDAIGISASVDDQRYLSLPFENNTSWRVGAGGTYTIGRGGLTVGAAYLSENQLSSQFGALASSTPVPYHVLDTRASYSLVAGRFTLTPNIDYQELTYGDAVVDGVPENQSYRNQHVLLGGLTTRFDLGGERSLLAVLQGVQSRYPDLSPGLLNNGSTGVLGLIGLDYQTAGVFRYQVLIGAETRSFSARAYGSQTAPIAEASVIWTPTALTTVTDTLSREISSPASSDIADVTYTTNTLVIDHELRRNILLQARLVVQLAEYLHAQNQDSTTIGGQVTWLISKHARLTGDFSSTHISGQPDGTSLLPTGAATPLSGDFTDNRFVVSLRLTP